MAKKNTERPQIYVIHAERRVKNSPFFLEGTDNAFDLPDEFPIPNECTILEREANGGGYVARVIRYIPQCSTIYKDEQIKQNWPMRYKLRGGDKKLLTFKQGKLVVPGTDKTRLEYLDKAGYSADLKAEQRYQGTQIIYQKFDAEKEADQALAFEDLVTAARSIIKELKVDECIHILRQHSPTRTFSSQTSISKYKLELNQLAGVNPEFVLNAIKGTETELKVLLSKAVEYKIVDILTPQKMRKRHLHEADKWEEMANIPDVGGAQRKFEKALDYLKTEKGKLWIPELTLQVEAHEKNMLAQTETQ